VTSLHPIHYDAVAPVYVRCPGDERQCEYVEQVGQCQRPDVAVGDRLDSNVMRVATDDDQHGTVAEQSDRERQQGRRRRHQPHRIEASFDAAAARSERLLPGHRASTDRSRRSPPSLVFVARRAFVQAIPVRFSEGPLFPWSVPHPKP